MSPTLLALLIAGSDHSMTAGVIALIVAVGATIGLYIGGVRCLRRKRLIENVPTSKVEGVFLGLTEVKGRTESHAPLRSYLAEMACVYYSFSVEEHWRRTVSYTDSKGNRQTRTESGWKTVRSDELRRPFFVRDSTGAIRIVPDKAEIQADTVFSRTCGRMDPLYYAKGPAGSIANSTYTRRFTEHAIGMGQSVYVMGNAKLREDVLEPELRYDAQDEMFLISTGSEEDILKSYAWKSVACLVFSLIFALAAPFAYLCIIEKKDFGAALLLAWPFLLGIALAYFGLLSLSYFQLVYNGLVEVKNRMAQAFSMIDVQLARRADLVPNLVEVVKRLAGHEAGIQEGLAKLRADAVRPRGVGGMPDEALALGMASFANAQTRALSGLFGYVERYPRLTADAGFLKLHEELARTERKIALARTFFNESVTAYNNRLETLPDVVVAQLLRLKASPYFQIEPFERAPVQVRFEERAESVAQPKDFAHDAPLDGTES